MTFALFQNMLMKYEASMKHLSLSFLFITILFWGCSEKENNDITNPSISLNRASCIGCHTDYDYLKAVHTPDPPEPGGAGCGGETPHIEP